MSRKVWSSSGRRPARASVSDLFAGLMSGTSLDGVDAVLVCWPQGTQGRPEVLAHLHRPFEPTLRAELMALNQSGPDELRRAALAANGVALAYAQVLEQLLAQARVPASAVQAVGAHGQTVRHQPVGTPAERFTIQLLNAALLAERAGIDVVCDFRSRDVAAGGQGAPLVPAFHAALFGHGGVDQAVLNLGGIGNLTLLWGDGRIGGFDCGPGNVLLDLWSERHLGRAMDEGGRWAAGGQVDAALLQALLSEPFLALLPPKSTGRDLFHAAWLQPRLAQTTASPQDVQATLAEFSARAAADALQRTLPTATRLTVCGGGAFNTDLMQRLARLLPQVSVRSSGAAGLPPDQVEAVAFAWLAQAFVRREPGNRIEVTGASGLRVLGALHPATPPRRAVPGG